jgi:putative ABC transport system permease protein
MGGAADLSDVTGWVRFAVGLLLVCGLTLGLGRWARIGLGPAPLLALLRAAAQLAAIALLLRGILAVPWTVAAFVVLMLSTATVTASGRLRGLWHGRRAALLGLAGGAVPAVALVFALGLVQLEVRYVVAVAGIVIGSAMSAATLAGRNFARDAHRRRDEVEAWLSLGASPARAHDEIGRTAVRESLLPNLDQTRSTGLVTLPGAFVGALFGGASPVEAAQFQLVVLAAIALAMTTTGVVVTRLAGRTPYLAEVDPG